MGTSKDESLFSLATDAISFTTSPDFENPQDGNTDNAYVIDVIATDGTGNTTTQEVTITVTDADEVAPTFTSATSVSVAENTMGNIYTAAANETVTFTLGTSKDESLFTLTTDAISFKTSPDFENPQDGNTDNAYAIDVIATDGSGNATTQEVTIMVTNVDEVAPVFTSATSVSVEEGIAENTIIYTAVATDDNTITYTISGTDAESFALDATSGELTILVSPDFDTQSSYEITITATDEVGNTTDLMLDVMVDEQEEALSVRVAEHQEVSVYPNPVQDILTLVMHNGYSGEVTLRLVTLDGKQALKEIETKSSTMLKLERPINVEAGLYLLQIRYDNQLETRRIIVSD